MVPISTEVEALLGKVEGARATATAAERVVVAVIMAVEWHAIQGTVNDQADVSRNKCVVLGYSNMLESQVRLPLDHLDS